MAIFHDRFKKILKDRNMTMAKLSEITGISYQTINSWDKERTTPKADNLLDICKALKVSADYLIGLSEQEEFKEIQFITKKTGLSKPSIELLTQVPETVSGGLDKALSSSMSIILLTDLEIYFLNYSFYEKTLYRKNAKAKNYISFFKPSMLKSGVLTEITNTLHYIDTEINNTDSLENAKRLKQINKAMENK